MPHYPGVRLHPGDNMTAVGGKGMSTLGVMALVALLLIGVIISITIFFLRGQAARDDIRQRHLEIIGLAEEYYFDRHRVYGDIASLKSENLLPAEVIDPATGQMYALYLNNLNDEWCAWTRSEVKNSLYFTRYEAGDNIVINQPTNLATCKLSL